MKKIILLISVSICFAVISSLQISLAADITLNNVPVQIYFSPNGGCTEAIVKEISHAKSELLIQAYSFTSKEIAEAIVKAHKKGIYVEIILDKSNKSAKYSAGDFTAHMGIITYIDDKHAIAHNKIMILDKETVITGSFNFTKAAEEKNAENLLIIKSKELAKIYTDNWNEHKKHSYRYEGK
jgi:phosphatidylserine/phosphatidylglycerophosphate/cardiolipin synthase-like enzyme